MDHAAKRAAELASAARIYVPREITSAGVWTRKDTREYLVEIAEQLGFSDLEISAAVDEALTAAGTTP